MSNGVVVSGAEYETIDDYETIILVGEENKAQSLYATTLHGVPITEVLEEGFGGTQ